MNPTQFGPTEDLAVYPRDPEGDRAKLAAAGVDALFEPATLYDADPPHETYVTVEALQARRRGRGGAAAVRGVRAALKPPPSRTPSLPAQLGLCGRSRPTHFRGVATVVCKLLNLTRPHLAARLPPSHTLTHTYTLHTHNFARLSIRSPLLFS